MKDEKQSKPAKTLTPKRRKSIEKYWENWGKKLVENLNRNTKAEEDDPNYKPPL